MIWTLLALESCICAFTEYVLPLSLPQLKVLPLNGDKKSSADDEIDGVFSCLFEIFEIALHPGGAVLFHAL